MPIRMTDIVLDSMEVLSLVDKGASGDEENRPSIVLFKRKQKPSFVEKLKQLIKGSPEPIDKAGQSVDLEKAEPMKLQELVTAIDELGLSDEQKSGVLALLEAFKAGPAEEPKPEDPKPPVEKAEEEPAPPKPEEEEQQMSKREKEKEQEIVELQKRIAKMEEDAERIDLEKRADQLAYLPMSKEETVALIKRNKDDEAFMAVLEKLNKASKDSPLLKQHGSKGAEAETPLEKREKLIKKEMDLLRKEGKKSTYEIAFTNVCKANPDLYRVQED